MKWNNKEIVELSNEDLATLSSQLEAADVKNQSNRAEASKNPRFAKMNKKRTSLGERNPVFDELLNAVRLEMKNRNFERSPQTNDPWANTNQTQE